ncbi:alanine dehydrogenase [bacterium]|nr:alanine dehydrogenase [bacterium]
MLIGVPTEIKAREYRVGVTPAGAREFVHHGHEVLVQAGAGDGIGLTDDDYRNAGAEIADDAASVFERADMIIKVKEPQPDECRMLRQGQVLFTYLHLAPDPDQTKLLVESGCVAIAYETVTDKNGTLPLLTPMSEVAGRMSIQAGAHALERAQGGNGTLIGGVPGVAPANVAILGGGVVGYNAARMAVGLGADVNIIDRSIPRLKQLDELFAGRLTTLFSTQDSLEHSLRNADLVIGAVLLPGAAAPKLIKREHLGIMRSRAVIVDVAIDQGGCTETSKATTHDNPTYIVDDVVHYCVANMPGAVARTSTFALTNATLPFAVALADKGYKKALQDDVHLRNGLNVHGGKVTCQAVAEALDYVYVPAEDVLTAHVG